MTTPTIREALEELLALDDIAYRIENWDTDSGKRSAVLAMMADYERRKPLAWSAARTALSQGAQKEATPFARMEDGRYAAAEAEDKLAEILGVELLGLSFDDYDSSFEIYPMREVEDLTVSDEQHAAIMALGCLRYWINFADGTERYCRGERKKAVGNRWDSHNSMAERKRSVAQKEEPREGWIAVSERLPEPGQRVLYYFEHVGTWMGEFVDGTCQMDAMFMSRGGFLTGDVTHWMPIPSAPTITTPNREGSTT